MKKNLFEKYSTHKNATFYYFDDTQLGILHLPTRNDGVESSESFRDFIRTRIAPVSYISPFQLPSDCFTIAVHYRTGEGYDHERFTSVQKDENNSNPKFRPFGYYIEQIKKVRGVYARHKIIHSYFYRRTEAS